MMRPIVRTASTGYCPIAVSAESITASVPSQTALATSLVSARVATGCVIIDSSICVAVITGMANSLATLMMSFWARGTRSGGICTPRSPRATISPSAPAAMPRTLSSASGRSILAISAGGRGAVPTGDFASKAEIGRVGDEREPDEIDPLLDAPAADPRDRPLSAIRP